MIKKIKFVIMNVILVIGSAVTKSFFMMFIGMIGASLVAVCNGIVFVDMGIPGVFLFVMALPFIAIGEYIDLIVQRRKANAQ